MNDPSSGIKAWTTDAKRRRDLSVLIPLLNVQDRLQTYLDHTGETLKAFPGRIELIVVDRGSTDGTHGLLAHQNLTEVGGRALRRIYLEENATEGAALRAGLSRAKGHSFAVLGGNLGAPPSCLGAQLSALDEGAELVVFRVGPALAASFACAWEPAQYVARALSGPDHPLSALLKLPLRKREISWTPPHAGAGAAGGFEGFIPFSPLAWFDRWRRLVPPRVLHDTES